jgi:Cu-Zn family superoxide dismutase
VIALSSLVSAQAPATATATLKDAQGQTLGTATFRAAPTGILLKVDLTGAAPGVHGLHIHTTGKCEAPMFTSAGGHFAPGGTKHGLMAAMGPHAGDLPNVFVGSDGKGSAEIFVRGVTLAAGPTSILDADGSALVLHATADDYLTDPAGNAGGRIACGVIAP